jgi:hypothetical protein
MHGQAEAIAMLVEISQRYAQDLKLQRAIIKALGYSNSAASAHVLKQMLSRYPQAEMCQLIWRALAATASDTAVEILRGCLKNNPKPQERQALQQALKRAYREDAA